jgi:hypothetical protein
MEFALLGMKITRLTSIQIASFAFSAIAAPAQAQASGSQDHAIDVLALVGTRNVFFDGTCAEGGGQLMMGGAIRYHGAGRASVGAEVTYFRPCVMQTYTYVHPQVGLLVSFLRDLNRSSTANVYLVAGVGATRHQSRYVPPAFKGDLFAGFGVRIRAGRVVIAPEAQIGLGSTRVLVNVGARVR